MSVLETTCVAVSWQLCCSTEAGSGTSTEYQLWFTVSTCVLLVRCAAPGGVTSTPPISLLGPVHPRESTSLPWIVLYWS